LKHTQLSNTSAADHASRTAMSTGIKVDVVALLGLNFGAPKSEPAGLLYHHAHGTARGSSARSRRGLLVLEPFAITNKTMVRLGPDTAIVGGEARMRGTRNGEPFAQHFFYSDTFLRNNGR
jgi:hypothetical protein